jgi:hypothetical protein
VSALAFYESEAIPPKRGKLIVHVVCTAAAERIAVVRVEREVGPVVWHKGPGSTAPEWSTPLAEIREALEVWCPVHGRTSVDAVGLRAITAKAMKAPTPLKLAV